MANTIPFAKLWANHPYAARGEDAPCKHNGKPSFENECAIRMGVTLAAAGLDMSQYPHATCWFSGHPKSHTLRARELAPWLETSDIQAKLGSLTKHKNVTYQKFLNKTGIVYFENFWGTNNQGDHIDLWDGTGSHTADGKPGIAKGDLDYFERSEEIWFWNVA
jgi:hypothetical protein